MPNETDLEITLPGSEEETGEEAEQEIDEEESDSSESEGEDKEEDEDEAEDGNESEDDDSEKEESDKEKEDKEDEDEDEDEDKSKDKGKFKHSRPSYRDIKEKFPGFFKTFPDLRDAFFREKEYSKIFPTVDDAREALEYANSFSQVSQSLMQGNPEVLFSQLIDANPNAFRQVAENFLPTIHKLDKDTFFEITTPLFERFVKSMDEEGIRSNNVNLRKAALLVGQFMTGKLEIPDSSSKKREDPERARFEQEKTQFHQKRLQSAQAEVYDVAGNQLNEVIETSLKEINDLSEWERQKLSEDILKGINKALTQDERHMALMQSLWNKWGRSNFSVDAKKRLIAAYLTRAKQVIVPVRDRLLKDAMKRKPVKKNVKPQRESDEQEETNSSKGSTKVTSGKQVDWSKTSDRDFLNDKFVLRK